MEPSSKQTSPQNLAIVATLFGAAGLTMFLMTQDLSFTGYYYRFNLRYLDVDRHALLGHVC